MILKFIFITYEENYYVAELNFSNINGIHLNNNNKLLLLSTNIAITGC